MYVPINMKKFLTVLLLITSFLSYSQNPNDCEFAIVLCGNSNIGLDPVGIGFDEFSLPGNTQPSCYFFDQNTIWFKVEFVGAGTFTFNIIPDDGIADYDFAIFGSNVTCTTLGEAIRCSSTNPEQAGVSANTGLNMTETDTTEGPGEDGNGYLMYIDAEAGDIYYILVDRAVGDNGFSLNLTGTAILPQGVTAFPVDNLLQCDTDGTQDGFTEFNLDSQIPAITGGQEDTIVTFHETLNDANIGINELTSPYQNTSNPQTIYARIESINGCSDITTFNIDIGNPTLMSPDNVEICSYNGTEEYLLDTIIPEIIPDPTGYLFSYYFTLIDAENNTNSITTETTTFTSAPTTIYVRATDENDPLCFSVTSFVGYTTEIILANPPSNIEVCDDDFDEITTFDLSTLYDEILNGLNPSDFDISFFITEEDREEDQNRIPEIYENIANPQTIFIRFEEIATGCFDRIQTNIIVNPLPIPVFEQEPYIYCLNATEPLTISVPSSFQYYVWSNGEEGTNINSINITNGGTYTVTVTVTNEFDCENSVNTSVLESNIATINDIIIEDFTGNNTATVIVEGPGNYEYSLNNEYTYQNNNVFSGLLNGYYTVYVRDKNGCGVAAREFLILDYPRFFTPNQDGYHDTWKIIGISEFPLTEIYIFDRFGKLLKQISPLSEGWDGTYNGNPLPSSDYWFTINMKDKKPIRGHFTLKR